MTIQSKILIADDDASIRLVLSQAFSRLGYQVRATSNASTLLKWVSDGEGDLVITDVVMPDENVFDVLPRIRKQRPRLPVIVMSAQNTLLTAVNAAEIGAYEYVPKPFDLDDMTAAAKRALARPADTEVAKAQARAVRDERLPLIGRSPPMQEVYRTVARLVGADLTVLVTGESGTGKELVARALHDLGRRRDGRFVAVNLAATPRERVESELFGKGDETGKLVEADGGTLFLDEVGDMPLDAQTRLLRVIDGSERAINPRTGRPADARIIAATNRDLRGLIQHGLFREDLFFRLNVVNLRLPPLRERPLDIELLGEHFARRFADMNQMPARPLSEAAKRQLLAHPWRGNVRELENTIHRAVLLTTGDEIGPEVLMPADSRLPYDPSAAAVASAAAAAQAGTKPLVGRTVADVERDLIIDTLLHCLGNRTHAANILGISIRTLRNKLRQYTDEGFGVPSPGEAERPTA